MKNITFSNIKTLRHLARISAASSHAGLLSPGKNPEVYHTFPREHVLTLGSEARRSVEHRESFHLKFRTRQLSNSTVIAHGRTNEHYFNVEINEGRLVYRFADDNGLAISSYSLPSKQINDGEWHKLIIERQKSKFLISLDNERYTEVSFGKSLSENVFAGSRIMLGFNVEGNRIEQFEGDIAEVIILIGDQPLATRELPVDYKDVVNLKLIEASNMSGGVEKVIIRMDMTAGSSVSFGEKHDSEIVLRYPEQKDLDSFGITFRASFDGIVASLLGDHTFVGLEVHGEQLIILVKNLRGETVEHNLGRTEYNVEHTVHLRNDRQGDHGNMNAWLTRNRAAAVSVPVLNPFLIDRIVLGGEVRNPSFKNRKPILGCIKKPYLNLFNINLEPVVPQSRSDCRISRSHQSPHIQAVAFGQNDRPLPFTYADNDKKRFQSLELEFSTLEQWGIIVSLHDSVDNFIALHLQNGTLHLTIDDSNIEQQSFPLSTDHLNDGRYHRIKIMNSANGRDYANVDNSNRIYFPANIVSDFWITTIYFGAADHWAKDHYSLMGHGPHFVGCLRNIRFNDDTIIRNDHIKDRTRINSHCRPAIRHVRPAVLYLNPSVSFSCREPSHTVQVGLSNNEDFSTLSLPFSTVARDGVVASLTSSIDRKIILLYLNNGRLNLEYKDYDTKEELQLVTDVQVNDGQTHNVRLSRGSTGKLLLHVGDIEYSIALPQGSAPLFFDNLSIGGAFDGTHSSGNFEGCFNNVEYNRASIVPSNNVPKGRHECRIANRKICDAGSCPSTIRYTPNFCPTRKCGLTCQAADSSIVTYYVNNQRSKPSEQQKIAFAFRADQSNKAQMVKSVGTNAQLSINLEDGICYLLLDGNVGESGVYQKRFDCPRKRVTDSKFHTINLLKNDRKLNLSLDNWNEAIIYDLGNVPTTFDLLNEQLVLCSNSYSGQLQDLIIGKDGEEIEVLDDIIANPSRSSIGHEAHWHDRYSQMSKREVDLSEEICASLVCKPGARKCRSKRSTKKVCICVDANESDCDATGVDPCASLSCNHGSCVRQDNYGVCKCMDGFIGPNCNLRDPCLRLPCQNGGTCMSQITSSNEATFVCYCTTAYTGTYCETSFQQQPAPPVDPCQNVYCYNNGYCSNGQCICPATHTGLYCEVSIQVDPCANIVCQNGGQCRGGRCECSPYFTGSYCELPRDPCASVVCQNGGQCQYGRCECGPYFAGAYCEVPLPMDPCSSVVCQNGGQCQYGRCVCPAYFTGNFCEQKDECAGACHNGAACVSGQCVCPPKFKGKYCDVPDPCFGVVCKNGGQCDETAVLANSLKLCNCPVGYYGRYCEIKSDPCYNLNCNNGQCIDGVCQCSPGYMGELCDQIADVCSGVECLNGGSCFDGGCLCISHFFGDHCELLGSTAIPQTYQLGLKGGLIEYGRVPKKRGKWIGGVLAIASGLALGALATIYGVRQCAEGACLGGRSTRIPIDTGTTIPVMTAGTVHADPVATVISHTVPGVYSEECGGVEHHASSMVTEDRQRLLPVETVGDVGRVGRAAGITTEKIETIHERLVEGDLIDTGMGFATTGAAIATAAAPMYHVPPIADFGYDGVRTDSGNAQYATDGAEAWDSVTTGGAGFATMGQGVSSLEMMSPSGFGYQAGSPMMPDYELSNTMALTLTPNGKYAIVGQSQGPPQIWDAQTGNLINSMYGSCTNCTQLALACNGTLLVGLASDIADTQPCIVQLWDVSNGRPIHLSHQIKCSAFTLSNNMNNLVMAGNQKYGRGISVGILDLVSNELTKELKSDSHMPFGRDPSFIALTPDERHAIVGCFNQTQGLTNYVVFDLTADTETVQPPHISLDCDPKNCTVLNNSECIAAVNNGQLFVWDINTCKPVHYFSDSNLDKVAHRNRINDIQLSSPNKSMMITASNDGTAKVWDTVNRTLMTRLLGHNGEVTCCCFSQRSPDSQQQQLVVTGARDLTICLWRLPSGQLAAQINIGMVPIKALMAAHNRTVVAIGEKDTERQLLMLRVMQQTHHQS
ncbi:hypothetical protein ACOME3_008192 [Neoechinorhynchus agilis]